LRANSVDVWYARLQDVEGTGAGKEPWLVGHLRTVREAPFVKPA
jgi:hypothetical protein